jgi:SanA protein
MKFKHSSRKMSRKKRIMLIVLLTFIIGALSPFLINAIVINSTSKYIVTKEEAASLNADCIIVLGALVWDNNRLSNMLEDRVIIGTELYKLNVAPKMLMSGDHGRIEYDEVNAMMNYALKKDVKIDDIFLDHAGFSTYESMYRARDVFKAKKVIIVTQKYHLYRAVYVARALGLDAYGVSSDLRPYNGQKSNEMREFLARTKDFFTSIFKPKPKYLGDAIPVSGSADITHDKK